MTERIVRLFRERLNVAVPSTDTDLIAGGVLDSLALVELLGAIESEFDVALTLDELDIDDLRTVDRIRELVEAGRDPANA